MRAALFAKLVSPRALNWCLLPLVAIAIAGCSAEATRFSEDGYASRPASGPVAAPRLPPMGAPPQYQYAPPVPATPVAAVAPVGPPANTTPLGAAASGTGQTLQPVPPVHTVAAGDTLRKISRQYQVKVKDLAVANGIEPDARLSIGMKITIPVAAAKGQSATASAKATAKATATAQAAGPAGAKHHQSAHTGSSPSAPTKTASADPPANARVATTGDALGDDSGAAAGGAAANGQPAFRWPLRGRVINHFGAKVNGAANHGIDFAVPKGTPVRAADDGVVAYAGNELKSYGNLVLVRHANGFVTAYANASELMVKSNDQVHKGQVIAKSGQTGTAANPQLHFEVRKNSAPVDPMQYLPADKTSGYRG